MINPGAAVLTGFYRLVTANWKSKRFCSKQHLFNFSEMVYNRWDITMHTS